MRSARERDNIAVPMTTLWDGARSALPSIAHAVGRTPMVRLNRITADLRPPIYLKLEWYGPSGSLKDRIYLHMFERAEARGELRPGVRVLECSTGNAGIACAFVAAVKGYPCTIVMPEGMSEERKKLIRAYGATLIQTPGGDDCGGAPRTGQRHILALGNFGHDDSFSRDFIRTRQARPLHQPPIVEDRQVHLASACIVNHRPPPAGWRDRFVRRHRAHLLSECERHSLNRGQTDSNAREGSRPSGHGEEINVPPIDSRFAQQPIDRRQQLLISRALSLRRCGSKKIRVAEKRHR